LAKTTYKAIGPSTDAMKQNEKINANISQDLHNNWSRHDGNREKLCQEYDETLNRKIKEVREHDKDMYGVKRQI
jgi:hypothetical protein